MGKGKTSRNVHTSAHNEPSCTEQDGRGKARSLGQDESTAKEGGIRKR
jgi:hypothetical protein